MKLIASFLFATLLLAQLVAAQELTVRIAALVIGTEAYPSTASSSIVDVLNGYGIPSQTVTIPTAGFQGPFSLEESPNVGRYAIIVLADAKMGSITPQQYDQLTAYEIKFKARRIIMNQFPGPEWNVAYIDGSACCGYDVEELWSFNATTLNALGTGIKPTAQLSTMGLWHYSATITDTSRTIPLLTTPKGVGAVIVNQPDSRQEMIFFIPFATFSITSSLLAHVMVSWGFRNIYPGIRRVYLSTQIDDIFLSTELWDPALKNTNDANPFRITGSDLTAHASWTKSIRSYMPTGSNYTIEMAFNGNGVLEQTAQNPVYTTQGEDADYSFVKPAGTGSSYWPPNYPETPAWKLAASRKDTLFAYANNANRAENFYWLSHTFTHLSLNNVSKSDVVKEIQYNQKFTTFAGLTGNLNIFSDNAIVTPRITGFNNSDALAAMYENGIRSAVGDNSRNIFNNENIHWGITTTTATHGFNGFFIIPRFPTEIYFHCSLPSENLDVYNYIISLNPVFASYATNDFNVLLSREAQRVIRYMMLLRKDGHMFHQANLRVADTGVVRKTLPNGRTGKYSLLMEWVEYISWQYTRLVGWPIITLKQSDLHRVYLEREARDKCNYDLLVNFDATSSNINSLMLKASKVCKIPVTSKTTIASNSAITGSEKIGIDHTTYWVNSAANGNVNLTLTAATAW